MDAPTKIGRQVLEYLEEHPDETSPTVIARDTGVSRQTARTYRDQWHAERRGQNSGQERQEQPPATEETGHSGGRDITRDFPAKKPPEPEPAADEDLDDDEDDVEYELEW